MKTRCPACSTVFRVRAEQLKTRQGKVRCGQCQQVFDALQMLVVEPPAPAPAPAPVPSAAPPNLSDLAENIVNAHIYALEERGLADDAQTTEQSFTPLELTETTQQDAEEEPLLEHEAGPIPAAAIDFLPSSPASRRWPWLIGLALATCALSIQALVYFRVELAVLLPDARPALEMVCGLFDYPVELPRKVDLLGIDVSDLHPDPKAPGKLQLTATLKNRAPFTQVLPHLELTLTDIGDKPLVRKVLDPTLYLPQNQSVTAGFAANSEISVQLSLDPSGMSAVGYRLYLFYP